MIVTHFNQLHDQLCDTKLLFSCIDSKKNTIKIKNLTRFRPIFDFELKGKAHKPSRAENPLARALAGASSARTHH